jgi:hypothetical protein
MDHFNMMETRAPQSPNLIKTFLHKVKILLIKSFSFLVVLRNHNLDNQTGQYSY